MKILKKKRPFFLFLNIAVNLNSPCEMHVSMPNANVISVKAFSNCFSENHFYFNNIPCSVVDV